MTQTYSSDLRNLIMYLLTNPNRVKSVNDLMPMIGTKRNLCVRIADHDHFPGFTFSGARFYTHLDAAYTRCDTIEHELSKEVESTRLFRLLTKLCTVVDRAELNGDFGWAEYGDRYMLKLFRDYVFHQVTKFSASQNLTASDFPLSWRMICPKFYCVICFPPGNAIFCKRNIDLVLFHAFSDDYLPKI